MSRYEDSGIEEIMRESGERFEEILRETRAIASEAEASRLHAEADAPRLRKEREIDRALRRELLARIDRLKKRDPDA